MRVVVLRGQGRSFSSGIDRTVLGTGPIPDEQQIASYQEGFSWLGRPDLLSLAAVQGYALGAGFQLALACDLRVLTTDAQLALPEPTLGLVPDLGGTHPLVRTVGYGRALELCLTGRRLTADQAFAWGLASAVVAPDQLDAAVHDLVAALLAVPRGAAVETKALLAAALRQDVAEQRSSERAAQVRRLVELAGEPTD